MQYYHRLVPVILFDNGSTFRTQEFTRHYTLGDPVQQLERYKVWDVDEIVYLDMHRTRQGQRLIDYLPAIAHNCFAPLAAGGGVRTLDDIKRLFDAGADRVVINTAAEANPEFITAAAQRYGSQAIIVSIDARRRNDGTYEVITDSGSHSTGRTAVEWAVEAAARGAGEIFLNSMDRDGMGGGYDIALLRNVTGSVSIPVIACGGIDAFDQFAEGILDGGANAVAAANIFCFTELSYLTAKDVLSAAGVRVRPSSPKSKKYRIAAAKG